MPTSRRALLVSISAIPLAGCTGETVPETESTTTQSRTEIPDGETATATPSAPEPPEQVDSSWPMPAADQGRSNFAPAATGPTEEVSLLWEAPTDDAGLSQPVLSDGVVYVGGDSGTVRALSARTGARQWQQSVGVATGTPWLYEDRLYVPTTDGLVALRSRDGVEQWRVDEPDCAGFLVSSHGSYYVRDTETPALVAHSLDGTKQWEQELTDVWSPALFAGPDMVFVGTDHHWSEPWRFSPEGNLRMENRPLLEGDDFPVARCYLDGVVYSSTPIFGKVSTYDASGGAYERQSRFVPSGSNAGGARYLGANGRTVFVYNHDRNQMVGLRDGEAVVRSDTIRDVVARPVLTSETMLVPTENRLHCFDPSSGDERWARSRDGIGTRLAVADNLLYTTAGGTVRAFRPA